MSEPAGVQAAVSSTGGSGEGDTPRGRISFGRRGEGPAVVLLHPLALAGNVWDEVGERLSAQFTAISPDARGHGREQLGRRTILDYRPGRRPRRLVGRAWHRHRPPGGDVDGWRHCDDLCRTAPGAGGPDGPRGHHRLVRSERGGGVGGACQACRPDTSGPSGPVPGGSLVHGYVSREATDAAAAGRADIPRHRQPGTCRGLPRHGLVRRSRAPARS